MLPNLHGGWHVTVNAEVRSYDAVKPAENLNIFSWVPPNSFKLIVIDEKMYSGSKIGIFPNRIIEWHQPGGDMIAPFGKRYSPNADILRGNAQELRQIPQFPVIFPMLTKIF